jgi:NTP pyrophosphatase (non-canonical NTP hydrolase)
MVKPFEEDYLDWQHSHELIRNVNELIDLVKKRGYEERDRLLRKLLEEIGEYCEAIEYFHGATRKIQKFKGVSPGEKLVEEIVDVAMAALVLASIEGVNIQSALEIIRLKLDLRETEYKKSLKEENDE